MSNAKFRKIITGAGSGALAAAPSGNPYLIAGAAIAGGVPGLFYEEREFDPNPFRRGFQRYARTARRRGRRATREVGTRTQTNMAARGIGGSELAASITSGAERATAQHVEDRIADRHAALEDNIAHAEAYVDEANRAEANKDWQGLASAAISTASELALGDSELAKMFRGSDQTPGEPDISDLKNLPQDTWQDDESELVRRGTRPAPGTLPSRPSNKSKTSMWTLPTEVPLEQPGLRPDRGSLPAPEVSVPEVPDLGTSIDVEDPPNTGTGRVPGMGSDDQIPSREAPYRTRTPQEPSLDEDLLNLRDNSTPNTVKTFLSKADIAPDSQLGRMFFMAPDQLSIIVGAYGIDWLKDAFSYA